MPISKIAFILLEQETRIIRNHLSKYKELYDREKINISDKLEPESYKIRGILDRILNEQKVNTELELRNSQLNELLIEQQEIELGLAAKNKQNSSDVKTTGLSLYIKAFVNIIQYLLKEWNFPDLGKVLFDEKELDLNISDKFRKDYGKGFRAIGYTAFIIGLMRYCIQQQLPHPGFVVLDSPLTTFRDRDQNEEDISEPMQENFFNTLRKSKEQIIILENKEPSNEIKYLINYIEFTKDSKGRYGFLKNKG
ncbi:hypothetical protein [Peribacillus deserti]|uniref:Uncharacterized protein n=1 Tax=Peribacillus deserti TaxID=673318 RepID=A0A2N5M1B9_9BACI|nr:hypothetical protein [Peribacillus deserti]PLT28157.1 hypothetical protein CUU66_19620 [Peribacillus deserti]